MASHSVHTRTHLNDRGSRGQFEKSSITVLSFVFKLFSVILIKMKAFVITYIKLPFSELINGVPIKAPNLCCVENWDTIRGHYQCLIIQVSIPNNCRENMYFCVI